jgi:hypothetical protein
MSFQTLLLVIQHRTWTSRTGHVAWAPQSHLEIRNNRNRNLRVVVVRGARYLDGDVAFSHIPY